ncbi:D-alanyl-D-alanine carboxypeptidase/D-alanyl-D-alanine-endopeptidase [Allopusillimonas ginsengisoli]|uniref:D-alanyl-D-alanine carboxypeptidase/D-alanyl-D-alanine endopeptidase n=1 Tax=Allopusillimonas ginsengisoli TaxID=453575 RepID=UPI0039C07BB6
MRSVATKLRQLTWGGGLWLLVCLAGPAALAQGLPPELASVWRSTRLPESALSLYVKEVGTSQPMILVNPTEPRNPASVMKTVTTWAGLSGLGSDYVWRTTMLARGGGRVDAQGTLSGPLYLKAGGDPFLTMQDLWGLLRQLRLRGIKNLTEVVVDRSLFGAVTIDPGAFDGAPDRPYNASPDAMMVGLGALRLIFQPDAAARKWIPVIDPPLRGVRVEGEIAWKDAVCPGSPSVSTQVVPSGNEFIIRVAGAAVGSCGEFSDYRVAFSQKAYFEGLFRMLWKELGGTLAKGVTEGRTPANATPVVWHDSRTLGDIIRYINKHSNNVMARTLLLTLGAQQTGPGATPASGAAAALGLLQSQGVDTRGWVIDNGAGLSRSSRLTAAGLGSMLDVAWLSPMMPEFISSLAIIGVDGTVRRRLRNDDAQGRAHLKTGTLRDAKALAGYVMGASGKRYILVKFVNGERAVAGGRAFDDALVSWLAER